MLLVPSDSGCNGSSGCFARVVSTARAQQLLCRMHASFVPVHGATLPGRCVSWLPVAPQASPRVGSHGIGVDHATFELRFTHLPEASRERPHSQYCPDSPRFGRLIIGVTGTLGPHRSTTKRAALRRWGPRGQGLEVVSVASRTMASMGDAPTATAAKASVRVHHYPSSCSAALPCGWCLHRSLASLIKPVISRL